MRKLTEFSLEVWPCGTLCRRGPGIDFLCEKATHGLPSSTKWHVRSVPTRGFRKWQPKISQDALDWVLDGLSTLYIRKQRRPLP